MKGSHGILLLLESSSSPNSSQFQQSSEISPELTYLLLKHVSGLMATEMKEEEEEQEPNSQASVETTLHQASELINALVTSSYSIKSFPLKWQAIRAKLDQLDSGLVAAISGNDSDGSSSLVKLLQAITSTVSETQLLASQCSDGTYAGGKLQMRSDLDVVFSKLELHLKHLAEIYASGMLIPSQAIVASRPGVGASREDMRFYAKDLFSRLRIGNSEMRTRAIAALNEILREDEKYVRIVVVDIAEGISFLSSLLEFDDKSIQEEAAEAVAMISGFDCCRGALLTAGVIAQLIHVLDAGSELGKERAARALQRLTENSDNSWSVSAHGGVTVLLKICGDDKSSGESIVLACGVLRNLSGVAEIKGFMVDEGLLSVLLKLSRSKEEASRIQAIAFLHHLASEDETIKQRVVREGIIESLVGLLDPSYPYSSKAREIALKAIEGFIFSSPSSLNALMASTFLERLLFFIRNGEVCIQESALKTVSRLCGVSEEAKKAMGELGFMPELMRFLETKSSVVQEMAAEALYSVVLIQRNRRRFVENDQNINRILQLLDPEEEKSVTRKYLLSLVMLLTESNGGRRKIVASGNVQNLEKLAEKDVADAKKTIKKLASNKFRRMLNRIWRS